MESEATLFKVSKTENILQNLKTCSISTKFIPKGFQILMVGIAESVGTRTGISVAYSSMVRLSIYYITMSLSLTRNHMEMLIMERTLDLLVLKFWSYDVIHR